MLPIFSYGKSLHTDIEKCYPLNWTLFVWACNEWRLGFLTSPLGRQWGIVQIPLSRWLTKTMHIVSLWANLYVDAQFCPGYCVLLFGPRAHLWRVSNLGLEPCPFLFAYLFYSSNLNCLVLVYLFHVYFCI